MHCQRCGSTDFEEENGLLYCCICQTQSQGFTQESEVTFIDRSKIMAKEIKSTRKPRERQRTRTSVLWTSTEAFNIIIINQMLKVYEINALDMNLDDFKWSTMTVWFQYLRKAQLSFTDTESADDEVITRRLHPATRYRDHQILTNKVIDALKPFKYGSSDLGFKSNYRLDNDSVIVTAEQLNSLIELIRPKSRPEMQCNGRHITKSRDYYKYKSSHKLSLETRRELYKMLAEIDINSSFDETVDLLDEKQLTESLLVNEDFDEEEEIIRELEDKEKKINILEMTDENECEINDFDRELIDNLTKSTKLFSKFIPLSYLKNSRNISSNYFLDFVSLPKTLAIINITLRLMKTDIFCFDLIRWAQQRHIPYYNCTNCLPDDWLFIPNDFEAFTSRYIPSYFTINLLSGKIADYIGIECFPKPDIGKLMERLIKDLNLPTDLIEIIEEHYDLFQHFPDVMDRNYNVLLKICDKPLPSVPHYERWAAMIIVVVLKQLFMLNDSSEMRLSHYAVNVTDVFNWCQWEQYCQHRLKVIQQYNIPLNRNEFCGVKDEDLMVNQLLERNKCDFRKRNDLIYTSISQKEHKSYDYRQEVSGEFSTEVSFVDQIEPSMYPLTTATEFALRRMNCPELTEKLSVNFSDKLLKVWSCNHGKAFHRPYVFVDKDPDKWSESLTVIMKLCCLLLQCKTKHLLPIINKIESKFFRYQRKSKRKKANYR
ncbi:uncharacterized protein LOC128964122 [Oppia nitens]|uniref:uncharacterized protein LOC128964122 n=1 Tax=Oppia nitens TaxID=1686743 RepID=UPI0023DBD92F|nr:uncharacterized protein LOC128964122 [Oppia nitens]